MSAEWPKVPLGVVLTPISRPVTIEPNETYRILGAHLYAQGLYTKEVKDGSIVCTGMNDTNSFAVLSTRMLVAFLNDGTMPVSRNIIQNPIICTSENVDQYYAG